MARQRLAPLLPHLKGVKHLIVLPSRALAGVPVETLVAALPDGTRRIRGQLRPFGIDVRPPDRAARRAFRPPRLLALGDPPFQAGPERPAPSRPTTASPIMAVAPNGIADLFGIKPGDVLLEYNGKVLESVNDLAIVPAGDKQLRVPSSSGATGEVRSLEIAAGPLGIQSNPNRPAAEVVLTQQRPPRCSGRASAPRASRPAGHPSRGPGHRRASSPRIRSRRCWAPRPPSRTCNSSPSRAL